MKAPEIRVRTGVAGIESQRRIEKLSRRRRVYGVCVSEKMAELVEECVALHRLRFGRFNDLQFVQRIGRVFHRELANVSFQLLFELRIRDSERLLKCLVDRLSLASQGQKSREL